MVKHANAELLMLVNVHSALKPAQTMNGESAKEQNILAQKNVLIIWIMIAMVLLMKIAIVFPELPDPVDIQTKEFADLEQKLALTMLGQNAKALFIPN